MLYKINNKDIKIPDEEIEKSIKLLQISKEEAIQMWLEDEGYLENEEQEKLCQKAKENRVTAHLGARVNVSNKTQKERVKKDNPVKEEIIKLISQALKNYENLDISKVNIENVGKIITFCVNDREFKVDLVEKRKKKE